MFWFCTYTVLLRSGVDHCFSSGVHPGFLWLWQSLHAINGQQWSRRKRVPHQLWFLLLTPAPPASGLWINKQKNNVFINCVIYLFNVMCTLSGKMAVIVLLICFIVLFNIISRYYFVSQYVTVPVLISHSLSKNKSVSNNGEELDTVIICQATSHCYSVSSYLSIEFIFLDILHPKTHKAVQTNYHITALTW